MQSKRAYAQVVWNCIFQDSRLLQDCPTFKNNSDGSGSMANTVDLDLKRELSGAL